MVCLTPWRNGSASGSRSEGCVFKSRRGQGNFGFFFYISSYLYRQTGGNGISVEFFCVRSLKDY